MTIKKYPKELYSPTDLAKEISVTSQLIRRWCKNERIDFLRTDSGHIVFTKEMVEKIKKWYLGSPPKKGRTRLPSNRTQFSITETSRKLNIDANVIREWIASNSIPYIKTASGMYQFTTEQIKEVARFANLNKEDKYSAVDVANLLDIDTDAIRLLAKLGKVDCEITLSGRILFSEEQIISLRNELESGVPLLTEREIGNYSRQKKDYYKAWYKENKEAVKRRRKEKRLRG